MVLDAVPAGHATQGGLAIDGGGAEEAVPGSVFFGWRVSVWSEATLQESADGRVIRDEMIVCDSAESLFEPGPGN